MVSGHVCADMTLASRDGWEEDGSAVKLWKVMAFRLSGLTEIPPKSTFRTKARAFTPKLPLLK